MDISFDHPAVKAALRLHAGLARQGPGSTRTTARLMELTPRLPTQPRALDLGCGPGASSIALANRLDAEVTAVDLYPPFLDELRDNAIAAGVSNRITTAAASMDDLPYPPESFDIIWCEGAVYNVGFDAALTTWKPLLEPNGVLVVTECCWTSLTPAAAARGYWDQTYPLRTVGSNVDAAIGAGYEVLATYLQPDSDWFTDYYTPLQERITNIDPTDDHMVEAGRQLQHEIDIRQAHSGDFGYVGFVLRPT